MENQRILESRGFNFRSIAVWSGQSGVHTLTPAVLGCLISILCSACSNEPVNTDDEPREEDTETETTPDVTDPSGRLSVEDGKLIDESGRRVALSGLSLGSMRDLKALGQWNEAYFEHTRDWGAKLVRLPVNPSSFRGDAEQTLKDLDDAARWCGNQDLYLIVDYHIIGNVNDAIFQFGHYSNSTWEELFDFWEAVGERFGDNPTVAFAEVYNEPASMDWMGGEWWFEEWKEQADAMIAVVREHAPEMIPLVAGLDWAYDLSWLGKHPFEDRDVALVVHPYPGHARTDRVSSWDNAFGYLSDEYPIVFTEFGFDENKSWSDYFRDDVTYGREIIAYARERHISWTAFVFFRGPPWPMPLFYDWETRTPTQSGAFFKDVLKGKDLDIAGDEFEEPAKEDAARGNGPSGFWWETWSVDYASVRLPSAPTKEQVSMHVDAAPGEQIGLACFFTDLLETQDLGRYNELAFKGDITEGAALSITLGTEGGMDGAPFQGCTFAITGEGSGEYVVDLLSPTTCVPEPCFDLSVSQVNFLNAKRDESVSFDISIESLELRENPDRPLPASGLVGTDDCG